MSAEEKICSRGHHFVKSKARPTCPTCWPGRYKKNGHYSFAAELWLYPSENAAWHFVTVPKKISAEIKERFGASARGWGSLRVAATAGKITWETSIFPDKRAGAYLLPIKADVRKRAGLRVGNMVKLMLVLL